MARRPQLVPDEEGAGRFLPWVIAVMAFLAALSAAGGLSLGTAVNAWRTGLTGALTVEVPPTNDGDRARRVGAIVEVLRSTAGIKDAAVLDDKELSQLLEPWLGRDYLVEDLPVPDLIDVELDKSHPVDIDFLARRLEAAVPGTRVDDHKAALDRLVRLARVVQLIAVAIVSLIALAMAIVVVFAIRAALSAHHEVIELLHQLGARDSYIARHFQNHGLLVGLRGGLVGLALAAVTLFVLMRFAGELGVPLLPPLALHPAELLALALVPIASGLVALLTARLTVLRVLARMP